MKRRLIIAALLLLTGAVVNVAVAWGCAFWSPLKMVTHPGSSAGRARPPTSFEQRWLADRGVVLATPDDVFVVEYRGVGAARLSVNHNHEVKVWNFFWAGWPARCLDGFIRHHRVRQRKHEHMDLIRVGPHNDGSFRRLPYRPMWPGFAVNTLFYATTLWLLIGGPFALRRFVRMKRGLCPKCAYPMGESAVCSECGKALSTCSHG